jgi:hypothetical protein
MCAGRATHQPDKLKLHNQQKANFLLRERSYNLDSKRKLKHRSLAADWSHLPTWRESSNHLPQFPDSRWKCRDIAADATSPNQGHFM